MPSSPGAFAPPKHDKRAPVSWTTFGKAAVAAAACVAVTACSGGGPSSNTPIGSMPSPPPPPVTPPPAPPPPPPPPPAPPPSGGFDTAEFRRSDGPGFHGATAAWSENYTGTGEIIAVIDSGLDSDSPEFTGRVHPDSADVAGNRGIDPEDDHGTNVALVAGAARDDTGVVGIAFDAQILGIRADNPGSCGMDTPDDPTLGCQFNDADIAAGINLAVSSGATVINLSLGGGSASSTLLRAVERAAAAGIVIVVAAGNGGDGSEPDIDPDQPDPFASSILAAGNGNVIIVGSVGDDRTISAFSNRAGNDAASYLTALGDRVCCVYEDGELFIETRGGDQFVTVFSGTSFAAPQVAGAVALLAQAFPNLTAQQIVEILLTTARDAGAAGTDSVYGTGILDIASAIAPVGQTMLAGTGMALAPVDDFALGSTAMGDALSGVSLNAIVQDQYQRAYNVELGRNARPAPQVERLRNAIAPQGITRAAGGGALSLAMTVGEGTRAGGLNWSSDLQLSSEEAEGARVLAARVAAQIAPDTQLGFAFAQGPKGLVGQLQGADRPAFSIAPQAGSGSGFLSTSEVAFAARRTVGPWGLTLSADRGRAWLSDQRDGPNGLTGLRERHPTSGLGLSFDRSVGGMDAILSLNWLGEDGTVLGGYFNPAFGVNGADSVFVDAEISSFVDPNWRLGLAARAGVTRPRGAGLLGSTSQVTSNAWSLDLSRRSTFSLGDTIGFRISQPLRVAGGGIDFDLPVAYDYATQSPIVARRRVSLAPDGREIVGEMSYATPLFFGYARASAFYRNQPGHIAAAPDDIGALVSFSASF